MGEEQGGAIVKAGQTAELGMQKFAKSAELSANATAAQARAEIEAAYIVAMNRPRDIDLVRQRILKACARPGFAQVALYRKPVGKNVIVGPSVRFAEEALRDYGNVRTTASVIYDDDQKRVVKVTVTDLETNVVYGEDITLEKTVERSYVKDGQEVLGERVNSQGRKTFLVRATEDDFQNKLRAGESKVIRNHGLRLIPGDIVEEAKALVEQTQRTRDAADPDAARKNVVDSFADIGIGADRLAEYLGHKLDVTTPAELTALRGIYSALRDGETNWVAVMESAGKTLTDKKVVEGSLTVEKLSKKEATHPAPSELEKAPPPPAEPDRVDEETGEVLEEPAPDSPSTPRDSKGKRLSDDDLIFVEKTKNVLRQTLAKADPETSDAILNEAGIDCPLAECNDLKLLNAALKLAKNKLNKPAAPPPPPPDDTEMKGGLFGDGVKTKKSR